ncbi:MAG: UDP-2,3-diacylglucosamine diphosphatase [Cocleimonas sp.]
MATSNKNKTFFISDLHLDPSRPDLFKLFDEFIDSISNQADTLYILGDLFEFWIGDDIIDLPAGKPYLPVLKKLKALVLSGTKLFFIQGNRDFLLQEKFIQYLGAEGAELLPDTQVIDLYGTPTLIMHGDTLCTDDKAYQRMRFIFRLKLVQKLYLFSSVKSRLRKLAKVRKLSINSKKQKDYAIMDVNQQTLEKVMKQAGVTQLIHGHTHRPEIHNFQLNGKLATRIVLGDWRDKACYFSADGSKTEFVH